MRAALQDAFWTGWAWGCVWSIPWTFVLAWRVFT
jgi:hypothetical protein